MTQPPMGTYKCWQCGHVINPGPITLTGLDRNWSPPPHSTPHSTEPFGSPHGGGWGHHLHIGISGDTESMGYGFCPRCGARLVW